MCLCVCAYSIARRSCFTIDMEAEGLLLNFEKCLCMCVFDSVKKLLSLICGHE